MVTAAEIREHGWVAAHEATMHPAVVPAGYECRTLVRQYDAVWCDRHEHDAEAEVRAAFEAMHGAGPLGVIVVEEPCVDGRRVIDGPIQVLVAAFAVRPVRRWHPPVAEPVPVAEQVLVEDVPPATPVPAKPRAKRTPKPCQTPPAAATVPPAPTWTPGQLDHKTHRPPSPGLSVDVHHPTTPTQPTPRQLTARAIGALAANTQATNDELREIAHMLTDPIPNAERIRSTT